MFLLASGVVFLAVASVVRVSEPAVQQHSSHTNNWAVLVCASRYWFNYRHVANTLSIYRSVKRLGIPDSNIILMLADDMACNARNPRPATVFNNANQHINVYGDDIEVDYRGYEVTVENFLRVLTGRLDSSVPGSKRLLSDDRSNILIYMTGHGGDGFLKFQDAEEISSAELADALEQMWQKRRYNELMFIIETCQAASMIQTFYSPNIVATGSSRVGEDALSHHMDNTIGVHIIDRWTYYALEFLEQVTPGSKATLKEFVLAVVVDYSVNFPLTDHLNLVPSEPLSACFKYFKPEKVKSTPEVRTDLYGRDLNKVLLTDFFGSVRNTEMLNSTHQQTQDVQNFLQRLQQLEQESSSCHASVEKHSHSSPPSAYQLHPRDILNITLTRKDSLPQAKASVTAGLVILVAMAIAATLGLYSLLSTPKIT